MSELQLITDADFRSTIAQGVTAVDFWAPWCGPCRQLGPFLEQLAAEFDGRARIVKLNVDESPLSAAECGVMSIPAVLLFRDGVRIGALAGAQPQSRYRDLIQGAL